MSQENQTIVQLDKSALGAVLESFRYMRDTPHVVDYNTQLTPPPEFLKSVISNLESYESAANDSIEILMNDSDLLGYGGFIYYAATHVDLEADTRDVLVALNRNFSDWQDSGFKLKDVGFRSISRPMCKHS